MNTGFLSYLKDEYSYETFRKAKWGKQKNNYLRMLLSNGYTKQIEI